MTPVQLVVAMARVQFKSFGAARERMAVFQALTRTVLYLHRSIWAAAYPLHVRASKCRYRWECSRRAQKYYATEGGPPGCQPEMGVL